MKNYKWGIIGCGSVTERKSGPAYQEAANFELHAVMRRDIEKAENYAKRHKVPKFYSNADDLINDPDVDAVYIATPPDSHALYALKVAAAGKPCCIEKPMAPSYEECISIEKVFEEKGLPLFVAYYRRSLPRFLKIKEWLDQNKIGEVRYVNYVYTRTASLQDTSMDYYWRTDKKIAYGGYFDDLASHALDLFVFLLGDVTEANGISKNQQGLYTAMDAVVGNWVHGSGVTGSGSWNFGADIQQDKVEIMGSNGIIRFAVFNDEPIVLEKKGERESLFIENPDPIQLHHVENIEKQLLEGVSHPSTGETAVHTTWIMDEILNKK
ncbi:Gfo/Idh/MocA family oxidoreductase [Flavicella sp.]|uniref:Gfo/Idh/MocA family protein n=1 Tax=Flavicella sp. TaxID=2957742 RepID=UPI003018D828